MQINRLLFLIPVTNAALVLAFFSTGAFGFFNLFDAAVIAKLISGIFLIFALILISAQNTIGPRLGSFYIFLVLLFFLYYGILHTISTGSFARGIVQSGAMMLAFVYILRMGDVNARRIGGLIVGLASISSLLGIIAFIIYLVDPSQINPNSFNLISSMTGDKAINAQSPLDYLSFTSGDGYSFFGTQIMRMKGYSNEPSSTIVYYLAPAALGFMYGRGYAVAALVMVMFSTLCVSSLIGIIIVAGSFAFYILMTLKRKLTVKIAFVTAVFVVLVVMLNPDFALQQIQNVGNILADSTNYDLLARKASSADTRLMSYNEGITGIINYPLGGSGKGSPTGLMLQLGLVGGIPLIVLYFAFTYKLVDHSHTAFHSMNRRGYKYGVALLASAVFVATLLSSYGWDRIPGVIIFALYLSELLRAEKSSNRSAVQ